MDSYEKLYKEVFERAKKLKETCDSTSVIGWCEYLFPELKESEDERIRKEITELVMQPTWKTEEECHRRRELCAWLEKQGEPKADCPQNHQDVNHPNGCIVMEDFNGGEGFYKVNLEYLNKKQVEEIEEMVRVWNKEISTQKFKVGDWIVSDVSHEDYRICKVLKIENDEYIIESIYGYQGHNNFETFDKDYHLWTIQDAKDGDVLVYGDNPADHHVRVIMLFKSTRTFDSAFNHFHIFNNEFRINDWCDYGKTTHPATKEQRDTFFAKMRKAGYEWDAEKKELKKIEQKPQRMVSAEAKDALYNKPDWSEEDEQYLLVCKNALAKYQTTDKWDANIISRWLEDKVKITKN